MHVAEEEKKNKEHKAAADEMGEFAALDVHQVITNPVLCREDASGEAEARRDGCSEASTPSSDASTTSCCRDYRLTPSPGC